MRNHLITLILAAGFIPGCSGLKTYSSDLDNNLRISSETESGSMFSSVNAELDIHRIKPDCSTEYAGTVELDGPPVDVGIPTGRSSYLVFVFESSGFLSSTSGSTSYDTLLRPRRGYQYDIKVSYKENLYNVVINEIAPGGKKRRELESKELAACRPISPAAKK